MNQRPVAAEQSIIPHTPITTTHASATSSDKLMFDKAESAEQIEKARDRYQQVKDEISELETQLGEKNDAVDQDAMQLQIARQKKQAERLQQLIEALEAKHS